MEEKHKHHCKQPVSCLHMLGMALLWPDSQTWHQQQEETKCSASWIVRRRWKSRTAAAECRETWSRQQDVTNVTLSVGTRGSSTVHSDSSRKEKNLFLSHQLKFVPSSRSQADPGGSSWRNGLFFFCLFKKKKQICWKGGWWFKKKTIYIF